MADRPLKAVLIEEAENELSDAGQWYEAQAGIGQRFLGAVNDAIRTIEDSPERHPAPPGYRGKLDVHRSMVKGFPYAVIYQIFPDRVRVVSIAHFSRRPFFWRGRLI
jgi:hypothetical protein